MKRRNSGVKRRGGKRYRRHRQREKSWRESGYAVRRRKREQEKRDE